jgi:hypothetical protein
MARLRRDQGKVQQAREVLAPVYEWFTEGFDTRDLKEGEGVARCVSKVKLGQHFSLSLNKGCQSRKLRHCANTPIASI